MFFSSASPNIPKTFSGCSFGRLVSVDLQLNEEVTSFTIDVFRDARSLSSFKQSGGRNVDVIIPMQRLRFYDMGHGPIGRLSGLLAVEELNLRRAHFMKQELAKDSLISASSPLVLPSLRAVSISEYEEGEPEVGFARFIFERINTPALTTLELDLLSEPAQLPTLCNPEALTSLILSFGEPAFEFSELLSLLRKTPNLVFLSLYDDWKTLPGVELLKALWADASKPILVPKLTTLELELHVLDEHYPMIVEMLGSRCVRHISRGDVAWCVFTSVTQAVTEICDAAWKSFRGKYTAGELGWSDAQMDVLNSRPLLLHRYDM